MFNIGTSMKWIFKLVFVIFILFDERNSVNGLPKKSATDSTGKQSPAKGKKDTLSTLDPVKKQIVGGATASMSNRAWQVAINTLQDDQFKFKCGGSLIAYDVVLTAAHCVRNPDVTSASVKVIAGEFDRDVMEGTEQTMLVSHIVVHPNYTGTLMSLYSHDIALLHLTSKVTINKNVAPIPALAESESVTSSTLCYMTGWGISSIKKSATNDLSPKLVEAEVSILPNTECNKRSNWDSLIEPYQMCAFNKQISACLGDSGGPLVCKVNNKFIQYGVTSWGSKTCDKKPSVFTRVSYYKDWIRTTMVEFSV